ncbi:hypothetical protein [Streptomyces sp. NPDC058664]|uniref:hypothetical protein n=1 Tax=unclassified Streptomyces TaxID=2593676 RepID=UPI00365A1152
MERAGGERRPPITVENGAGVVVIGDGNHVVNHQAPVVRSAYREQVRRIAPPELVGREAELADLAAFCLAESGPSYVWWRAEAWAGKTALLSWFALDPPPGVRIVPFFVTARLGAQNDVAAYTDVVLEQLAELAGEGLPALLTTATREAHLLRLYASAAEACAARGERLVLLVDGLDEDRGVTTGPDARSIAALLPYDLPVIVSGRLNPPLPADVPEHHPLRDPAIVRTLAPSPEARAIRAEAERELKSLLASGGLAYELLGLVTAAVGGLTADDLAELTGDVPYRVRDLLRTGLARTFALRGDAYLLAHEQLAVGAREMLGERELSRWKGVLDAWAERWRERGWPEESPAYLLQGYVPMLRAAGEVDRLVDSALDVVRHERLLVRTGADTVALGEVRAAEAALEAGDDRADLMAVALRLAFHRGELERRSGGVPPVLAAGWAAVGEADRAVALARSMGGVSAVKALCAVAAQLLERGERERAVALAEETEVATRAFRSGYTYDEAAKTTAMLWIEFGVYERAARLLPTIGTARPEVLLALVRVWCASGRHERALALIDKEPELQTRAMAAADAAEALIRSGRVTEAEQVLQAMSDLLMGWGFRLVDWAGWLRASVVLREMGHQERAETALRKGAVVVRWALDHDDPIASLALREYAVALAAAGDFDTAREHADRVGPHLFAEVLAKRGERESALTAAEGLETTSAAEVRGRLASRLASVGEVEEALVLTAGVPGDANLGAWPAIGSALLASDQLDRAAAPADRLMAGAARVRVLGALVRRLVEEGRAKRARALVADARDPVLSVVLADALHRVGRVAEARELLAEVERRHRAPTRAALVGELAGIARAVGAAGRRDTAGYLVRAIGDDWVLDVPTVVPAMLAAGQTVQAERCAWRSGPFHVAPLFSEVVAAYAAEGAFDRVDHLVSRSATPTYVVGAAAVAYAAVGARTRALDLVSRLSRESGLETRRAVMALQLAQEGDREGAHRLLGLPADEGARAGSRLLSAVAWARLSRGRSDALHLAHEAAEASPHHAAEALAIAGAYDEAAAHMRTVGADEAWVALPGLVAELFRAREYDRIATVLADLHHFGPPCGAAYAALARVHPDPVRARRFAALALRLGTWADALPAVLAVAPETLELVEAEGERLCRALEV